MGHDIAAPSFAMLTHSQCKAIHHASLEILRHTGVRVYHPGALASLRQADALIGDDNLVRISPALVEWALRQVPSRIALCYRGTDQVAAGLEGRHVSFGTGSDCLNYLDPRTGERRKPTVQDLVDCIHVVDALPELAFCMSMLIPVDEDGHNLYCRQFALMLEHTTKPVVFVCDDRADCEAIVAMACVAAGGMDQLRLNPTLLLYSEPSSPLSHSQSAIDKLLCMAENRLPVVHSPAPVQGGTAPVTLYGALAQANAEVLSGLVIHQLKQAGAPFVYGAGMHHLDMKTMTAVYGGPEFQLARVAVAEMGRFYGMPTWGYAGDSDSCVMDEQAAAESMFSTLVALLAGNNLTHDVGYLEQGLTTSPEMIVFTAEIITELRRFMDGISLDDESLAMETLHQEGPRGHFLTAEHTLRNFRILWQPTLFNRLRGEQWASRGSKRLHERLRDRTVSIVESHRPQPLPDKALAEIASIVRKRWGESNEQPSLLPA